MEVPVLRSDHPLETFASDLSPSSFNQLCTSAVLLNYLQNLVPGKTSVGRITGNG